MPPERNSSEFSVAFIHLLKYFAHNLGPLQKAELLVAIVRTLSTKCFLWELQTLFTSSSDSIRTNEKAFAKQTETSLELFVGTYPL